ncbi:MAG: hypothetical protein V1817_05065 [Candidatus Micrarchaeota archaeon]
MENRSVLALGLGAVLLVIVFIAAGVLLRGGLFAGTSTAAPSYSSGSDAIGGMNEKAYYPVGQGGQSAGGYITPPMPTQYNEPTYHVFNYFNSLAGWIALPLGFLSALVIIYELSKKTRSLLALLLYIIGTVLLFMSVTIFLFGLHDALTFKGVGETTVAPTFTQLYGWIIESVLMAVIGGASVWAGEFVRKREDEEESLVYVVLTPAAFLTALFALGVFVTGAGAMVFSGAAASYEWIIETILFGGVAAFAFKKITEAQASYGEEAVWSKYLLYAVGGVLLFSAFIMLLVSTIMILANSWGSWGATREWTPLVWSVLDAIVFTAAGVAAFYLADSLSKKLGTAESLFSGALQLFGALFVLSATAIFIFGFDSLTSNASVTAANYRSSFVWLIGAALYGLLGFASLRFDKEKNRLASMLTVSGALFWLIALANYFFAANDYSNTLAMRAGVHGVIALLLLFYADDVKRKANQSRMLPKLLSYPGILFMVITLATLILGVHDALYNPNAGTTWIMKSVAYAVLSALLIGVGNHLEPLIPQKTQSAPQPQTKPQPKPVRRK